MPWFALLPLGTLVVMAQDKSQADVGTLFAGALIVAGSIILAVWGICQIIRSAFRD